MCILRCLSMPSMPYCSMCMPIGWNGLSMPTDGCFVCMPVIITNSKQRGAEQDSVPYMMKVILADVPVECGVVDPNVYRFLNGSSQAMVLPMMVMLLGLVLCPEVSSVHRWVRVPSGALNTSPQRSWMSLLCIHHHIGAPHTGTSRQSHSFYLKDLCL